MNVIATPIPPKRGDRPLPPIAAALLALVRWALIACAILFAVKSFGT